MKPKYNTNIFEGFHQFNVGARLRDSMLESKNYNINYSCNNILLKLIKLVVIGFIIIQPALSGWDSNYVFPRCVGTGEYCTSDDIQQFFVYFVKNNGGYDIKVDILWNANSPRKYLYVVYDLVRTLGGSTVTLTDQTRCMGYIQPDANGWSRGLVIGTSSYIPGWTYYFQRGMFYWDTPASTYVDGCGSSCGDYSTSKCRKDLSAVVYAPLSVSGFAPPTCPGVPSQITLTITGGSGSYSYSWTDTSPSSLSCTTCMNPQATPPSTHTYHVVVTDTVTLVAVSTDVTVTVNPIAIPTISALIY